MGRTHRPVHRRGPVHHHDVAPKARRPAGHPHRTWRRILHPMTLPDRPGRWGIPIRVRLTLLYAGAFFVAGAALVAVLAVYFGHSLSNELSAHLAMTDQLRNHPAHDLAPDLLDQL